MCTRARERIADEHHTLIINEKKKKKLNSQRIADEHHTFIINVYPVDLDLQPVDLQL